MSEINKLTPASGRILKENSQPINIADKLSPTPLPSQSRMLTVTSAEAISLPNPGYAIHATIQPSKPIRFWLDGSIPTPTEGFYVGAYDTFEVESIDELLGCKMIAVSGTVTVAVGYTQQSV